MQNPAVQEPRRVDSDAAHGRSVASMARNVSLTLLRTYRPTLVAMTGAALGMSEAASNLNYSSGRLEAALERADPHAVDHWNDVFQRDAKQLRRQFTRMAELCGIKHTFRVLVQAVREM